VHLIEDGINNTSVFEPGEDERYVRFASTITMEAWLPLPTTWVRTVQKYGISIIHEETGEILDALETEYADKPEFWATGEKTQVLTWV